MENIFVTKSLLIELINENEVSKIKMIFENYNIVDLAEQVEKLELTQILYLFKVLHKAVSGQLFSYFDSESQEKLIEAFTSQEILDVLENLYSDDMADFVEDMPANIVKKVLSAATDDQREMINTLLSYPKDSAGSIMSTQFVELKENDTIEKSIKKIKHLGKIAETINFCYVTNKYRKLVGTISLKEIIYAKENEKIKELMDSDVIYVYTDTDQEQVAHLFKKYDVLVLPVVNNEDCLIGIITVDDIIDVFEDEVTEDIQKMAAIRPLEESYLETSSFEMMKSRIPWLLVLMVSATLTGAILTGFEEGLMVIPVLSAFVPMVMGTAGNAGSQAAVMVIRGIAVDDLKVKDLFKVLLKEFKIAAICGAVLFVVVMLRILILPPSVPLDIALVVSFAMVVSLFVAKLFGGLLPLIALSLKQDPAAMASPLVTTVVDALALIIYFLMCKYFLGI